MSSISAGGVGAIQSNTHIEQNQQTLKDAFRELATNLSINQPSDDAARLLIAERFNTEVQGVNQATLNTNDGIAVIQIADAGMKQIQEDQLRLQELAIQSLNGSLTDSDRQTIQAEASQIQEQIKSVISNTEYNDINLLNSSDKVSLQTGPDAGDQTGIKLTDLSNTLTPVDLTTQKGAEQAVLTIMNDLDKVSAARSELGATESSLTASISQLSSLSEALSVGGARIHNADIAEQSTRMVAATIRAQAGIAIQSQANLSSTRVHQLIQ
jgi:flagellin